MWSILTEIRRQNLLGGPGDSISGVSPNIIRYTMHEITKQNLMCDAFETHPCLLALLPGSLDSWAPGSQNTRARNQTTAPKRRNQTTAQQNETTPKTKAQKHQKPETTTQTDGAAPSLDEKITETQNHELNHGNPYSQRTPGGAAPFGSYSQISCGPVRTPLKIRRITESFNRGPPAA